VLEASGSTFHCFFSKLKFSSYTITFVYPSRFATIDSSTMNQVYHIQYDDSFAELPSTAPRNHPHILDLSTYRDNDGTVSTDIQLQDAIVTVLHKISDTTLSDFLNFTKAFRIVFENKSEPRGNRVFIMRKDNEVLVSHK
jgi:hypothetical protein